MRRTRKVKIIAIIMTLVIVAQLFSTNTMTYTVAASSQETGSSVETEFETETESVIATDLAADTELETETELTTETETAIESESVTDLESERLLTIDGAERTIFENLSKAIVEATKSDSELWNQLMTTIYDGDEESVAELAERFDVETSVMQQYLEYVGECFDRLYDALDEDDDLLTDIMQAQTDETLLSELAERFDIDTQTLLLFMNCTTVSYEATTLTSGSSLIETNTPEYNLIVNGKNYVAFSLDKTKTRTAGVNYSQKTSVSSTWNDWLKGTLSTPYTTSYWLINAVSYAASYYTNDTWISRTMTLFGCTSEQAKPILRAAIQQVIWYWTNYAKYPEIQGTTLYTLAKEIETASYKASYYMPDPFNWNWYVPVSTGYNNAVNISNSPNLLVATTGGDTSIDGMYVGYSGEAARAENPNVSTEKLYVTSFENYVTASSAADRIAKSQIAYCFNYDLHYPYSNMYGGWSAGTADDYNLYTETTDSNFATDKIMAIALNGYPNNASGFYTGQVTEGAFYLVTQYAIWYYTDNYVWEKAQERLSADEYTLYTNLLNSNLSTTLQNIKNKNANPESVEANINLYVTSRYAYNLSTGQYDENSATDKGFQNLLTVGLLSDAFNLPDGTLTISKTVTGDTANMPSNSTFTFEVVLTENSEPYLQSISWTKSDKTTGTSTPDKDGKVKFTLKNGENVKLTLPSGVSYTVTETNLPEHFTQTSPNGSATGTIESSANKTAAFTNNYGVEITEGTLTVGKTVTTASGSTADAPADKLNTSFSFEVAFQNSGAAYTDAVAWTKSDNTTGSFTPDSTGKVTFNLTGGQTITMTLPKGVTYTVSETNIPTDFTLASTTGSTSGTIAAGQDMTVTFTNQFADKIDLVGTKTWVGDDVNTRPSTITLQLWKHLDGTADTEDVLVVRGDFKGSFTASANTSGVWTYRFSGMPKYEGGKLITYYVKEPTVPDGYTCEVNGMDVTNTYVPKDYSLTLTKEVSGKFADTTKAFDFTITLKDKDGQAVTDSFDVETSTGVTASTIADGKIKFTDGTTTVALAHGQTIKIKNLKEGYTYEIQEQLGSDTLYTPSAKVEYTDSTGAAASQTMTTLSDGSIGTRTLGSNETVTYTNTRETIVPTGVRTENKPFIMIGVLALLLVGAAVVFYGTRRKAIKNFKNR